MLLFYIFLQTIGAEFICKTETKLRKKALEVWRKHPQLIILGDYEDTDESSNQLAVFSFLIKEEVSGRFLHHNFVAALLNDLFGIQVSLSV